MTDFQSKREEVTINEFLNGLEELDKAAPTRIELYRSAVPLLVKLLKKAVEQRDDLLDNNTHSSLEHIEEYKKECDQELDQIVQFEESNAELEQTVSNLIPMELLEFLFQRPHDQKIVFPLLNPILFGVPLFGGRPDFLQLIIINPYFGNELAIKKHNETNH